jgi:hypothetical protein
VAVLGGGARPAAASPASVREEEEGDRLGRVGQKALWVSWLGRKRGEIPFGNKT